MNDAPSGQLQLQVETLELINTEVTACLTRLSDAGSSIDTKAALLVGYAGAASAFLATRHAAPALAALAYVAYGLAAWFGIWAAAVRRHQEAPGPRQFLNGFAARPKAQALAVLAATRVTVFENNFRQHARKAWRWRISVVSLIVGVTLMVLALTSTYW